MKLKHKENGITINITSRRGKPLINKRGFINIEKGQYHACTEIQADVLFEKFEVVA